MSSRPNAYEAISQLATNRNFIKGKQHCGSTNPWTEIILMMNKANNNWNDVSKCSIIWATLHLFYVALQGGTDTDGIHVKIPKLINIQGILG